MDVAKIAREIVAREGGYVNDPDDPGGATNTQRFPLPRSVSSTNANPKVPT